MYFIWILLLLDSCLNDLLSVSVFSLSLILNLSLPILLYLLTRRWCPPVRNTHDTWLMLGDGRGERDYRSDTDPDTHSQREGGSWLSGLAPLVFCSCAVTVFSFVRTLETTE